MAQSNTAERILDDEDRQSSSPDSAKQNETAEQPQDLEALKGELSEQEYEDAKSEKRSIHQIALDRQKIETDALVQMDQASKAGEFSKFEIDEFKNRFQRVSKSADKAKQILDEIVKLREEKSKTGKEKQKRLSPEHPEIQKLKGEFTDTLKEALKDGVIRAQDEKQYHDWIDELIEQEPIIAVLEEKLTRFKGEKKDDNGLGPRREELEKLDALFAKYNLGKAIKAPNIKEANFKVRIIFRVNAEAAAKDLEEGAKKGYYTPESTSKIMESILTAKDPGEQMKIRNELITIRKDESEAFMKMHAVTNVEGVLMRDMSEASEKQFITWYKTLDLKNRRQELSQMDAYIKQEKDLAPQLRDIYINPKRKFEDRATLSIALKDFNRLDNAEKLRALERHRALAEKQMNENERRTEVLLMKAETSIHKAETKGYIRQKTADNYIKFFRDPTKWKLENGKKGLAALEEMCEILDGPADPKNKNLKAYEEQHATYMKELDELADRDSKLTKEQIQSRRDKFNESGYYQRTILLKQLQGEVAEKKKKSGGSKPLPGSLKNKIAHLQSSSENASELSEDEKEKIDNMTLTEIQESAHELLKPPKPQGLKALLYLGHWMEGHEEDAQDPGIIMLLHNAVNAITQFGTGKKRETDTSREQELTQEMKKLSKENFELKRELAELKRQRKTLKLNKEHSLRHQNKQKSINREAAEAETQFQGTTQLERELAADYFKKSEAQDKGKFTLNEEGKGEEITEFKIQTESVRREEDNTKIDQRIYEEQLKINKGGSSKLQMLDKDGRTRTLDEFEASVDKKAEEVEQKLREDTANKMNERERGKTDKKDFTNVQDEIAAARAAKKLRQEKEDELMERKVA